ncbi:MAG: pyruvate ferredoxin oxidoreductase [Spirochaetes bacterium RBG_16_49_21]|nr:MAG: pyruvate ferredoxin oxidoreductase [Spirochaetes bacterium RBG_16_49_21]
MNNKNKKGIEVSIALSESVKLCRFEAISAYPITPQTHIVEHLSELVAEGELAAEFITIESEHSALSACIGASAAGARTFTSTSSQGLELMHEILFIASGLRMPIVMAVANRALSAPLSIWNDHGDVMAARDAGWIQIFCENGQEAVDSIIIATRFAEDRRVLLPVMVNLDGFILSHVVEPIEFPAQESVDAFLPSYDPLYTLHPDRPLTMGAYALPELYTEARYAQENALINSKDVINEVMGEFGKKFGREYRVVESYNCEKADTVFVAMGSMNENIMTAIDELKSRGKEAGLVKIRLFRPFPSEELAEVLSGKKRIIVIDRAMPGGAMNGPVFSEISSLAKIRGLDAILSNFILGLGGRDVVPEAFIDIYNESMARTSTFVKAAKTNYRIVGVRE